MKSLAFCFVWIGEKIARSVRAVNGLTDSFYSLLLFAELKLDFSTSFLILYIHFPKEKKRKVYSYDKSFKCPCDSGTHLFRLDFWIHFILVLKKRKTKWAILKSVLSIFTLLKK